MSERLPPARAVHLPETVLPRHAVELNGAQAAFVDTGEGEAVVLIHGMTCSAASWNAVMPALVAGHRLVVPDLPGHGHATRARGDYSIAGFALYVRDLLIGLGIRKATLIGHSLGGGVAMQAAYAYPELVGRLVLVSSGGLGESIGLPLRTATLPGVEWVMPLVFNRFGARLADRVAGRTTARRLASVHELSYSYATLADPHARRAFVSLIRGVVDWTGQRIDASRRMRIAQDVPTMVVWGDADVIIPVGHGLRAAAELAVDRFEVFPGAGHFPHLEQPDRFVELVQDFLRDTAPADNSHGVLARAIRAEMLASDPTVRVPDESAGVA